MVENYNGPRTGYGPPAPDLGVEGDSYIDKQNWLEYVGKGTGNGGNGGNGGGGGTTTIPSGFFGINTHANANYEQYLSTTCDDYLSLADDLGLQLIRTNLSKGSVAAAQAPMFQEWSAAQVVPYIVVDMGVDLTKSYDDNYDKAYGLAREIAQPLVGSPCKLFEWSNEIDAKTRLDQNAGEVNPDDGLGIDGSVYSDFDDKKFDSWRGWMAGGVDGITELIPDALVSFASGIAFTHIPADMLLNGKDSKGEQTRQGVKIKFGGLHWYDTMHNPEAAQSKHYDADDRINVLQEMKDLGLPMYVSEWGGNDTDENQASYMAEQYQQWIDCREKYDLRGVMYYVLYADANDSGTNEPTINGVCAHCYGIIQADGSHRPAYDTMKQIHHDNTQTVSQSGSDPGSDPGNYTDDNGDVWGMPRAMPAPDDIPSAMGLFARDNGGLLYQIGETVLMEFGATAVNPHDDACFKLGRADQRWQYTYSAGLALGSAVYTEDTQLEANSPYRSIGAADGDIYIYVPTAPDPDDTRLFVNEGGGQMIVCYPARNGNATPALQQGDRLRLAYSEQLGYWTQD